MITEIVPTILTADFSEIVEKVKEIESFVPRLQVDILDGKFAANRTVSLEALAGFDFKTRVDFHLMVKDPQEWVDRALLAIPDRIIGQVEMMSDPTAFINKVIDSGVEVGIALDLPTPVEAVAEEIYCLANMVLILAAKAGFSGQEFDKQALTKIQKVREIVGNAVGIGVDCGLNEKNIPLCQKAGANVFCVSSTFWSAEDLAKRYNELLVLITKGD